MVTLPPFVNREPSQDCRHLQSLAAATKRWALEIKRKTFETTKIKQKKRRSFISVSVLSFCLFVCLLLPDGSATSGRRGVLCARQGADVPDASVPICRAALSNCPSWREIYGLYSLGVVFLVATLEWRVATEINFRKSRFFFFLLVLFVYRKKMKKKRDD